MSRAGIGARAGEDDAHSVDSEGAANDADTGEPGQRGGIADIGGGGDLEREEEEEEFEGKSC